MCARARNTKIQMWDPTKHIIIFFHTVASYVSAPEAVLLQECAVIYLTFPRAALFFHT